MASIAANLWALTKKTSDFVWSPEDQSAVDRIKKAIVAPTALQYFDSTQHVTIQVDASQRGLGAVFLQANGPVEFASKLLTETESRYSNIERDVGCSFWLGEVPLLRLRPACCCGILPQTAGGYLSKASVKCATSHR